MTVSINPVVSTDTFEEWWTKFNQLVSLGSSIPTLGSGQSNIGELVIEGDLSTNAKFYTDTITNYSPASTEISFESRILVEDGVSIDNDSGGSPYVVFQISGLDSWFIGTSADGDRLYFQNDANGDGVYFDSTWGIYSTNLVINDSMLPGYITAQISDISNHQETIRSWVSATGGLSYDANTGVFDMDPLDPLIVALGDLTTSNGDILGFDGPDSPVLHPSQAFGRSLLNTSDSSNFRDLLNFGEGFKDQVDQAIDLNTISESGFYWFWGGTPNSPVPGSSDMYTLQHIRYNSANTSQVAMSLDTGRILRRTRRLDVWSDWSVVGEQEVLISSGEVTTPVTTVDITWDNDPSFDSYTLRLKDFGTASDANIIQRKFLALLTDDGGDTWIATPYSSIFTSSSAYSSVEYETNSMIVGRNYTKRITADFDIRPQNGETLIYQSGVYQRATGLTETNRIDFTDGIHVVRGNNQINGIRFFVGSDVYPLAVGEWELIGKRALA